MKQRRILQQNNADILRKLLNDVIDKQRRAYSQLPTIEAIERMIKRVESGETTEPDLLIRALFALEQKESRQKYESLELAVRDKRELSKYFEEALEQAIAERDALMVSRLQRLQGLLNTPPATTRTISTTTVDEALRVLELKAKHPEWTYVKIATELSGNPSDAERLKKAVQRLRKAKAKEKPA